MKCRASTVLEQQGSGWTQQGSFWSTGQPDNIGDQDYVRMHQDVVVDARHTSNRRSISHHDLWLWEEETFARLVNVKASSSNPILTVDFDGSQATAQRPLILTEDHISVTNAATVWFRITEVANGTLQERASTSDSWVDMTKAIVGGLSQDYYAFTLAQLQSGLVAFLPTSATSPLTFDIQAADAADGTANLSDSDPTDDDADPTSVSVSVVALKTLDAGKQTRINDDGALTPDADTLDAWLAADDALQIFVVLQEGKRGIAGLSSGAVQERLSVASSHGVGSDKIVVSWDAVNWRLSLAAASSGSAARADFQAVLNAVQLQTVHFGQVSHRTISVLPDVPGDVPRKEFYVREVQVGASAPNPLLGVAFDALRCGLRTASGADRGAYIGIRPRHDGCVERLASGLGIDRRRVATPLFRLGRRLDQDSCRSSESVPGVHPCGVASRENSLSGRRRSCLGRWW